MNEQELKSALEFVFTNQTKVMKIVSLYKENASILQQLDQPEYMSDSELEEANRIDTQIREFWASPDASKWKQIQAELLDHFETLPSETYGTYRMHGFFIEANPQAEWVRVSKEVIVVGRHAPILPPNFKVVGQKDIQFPNDPKQVEIIWHELVNSVGNASILMQNVPAVLAGTFYQNAFDDGKFYAETFGNLPKYPEMFITVNGNRAPEGEKPVFELVAVLNIRTNKFVWSID